LKFTAKNPRTIHNEVNDCVVRALTIAFDRAYEVVHEACEQAGRRPMRGMYRHQTTKAIQILSGRQDIRLQWADEDSLDTYASKRMSPTFAQFAEAHPKGRFIVIKRGHAVALVDGVYYDQRKETCGARSRVQVYARIDV
jgi:hypothetical protein